MTQESDRLSTLDATFLVVETDTSPMHVGGIAIGAVSAVPARGGGVDIETLRARMHDVTLALPRLRQRAVHIRAPDHWIWEEPPNFDIDQHVMHAALPRPGGRKELEDLASHIYSLRLDRDRPLWEIWVVEGLEGDRFALIAKIHHSLLDGMGAVNLIAAMAAVSNSRLEPAAPHAKESEGSPILGELRRRLDGLRHIGAAIRHTLAGSGDESTLAHLRGLAGGTLQTLRAAVVPADATRLNPAHLSPHRRVATFETPFNALRDLRHALGGTINDIVLATVSGAIRRYLVRHGDNPDAMHDFRALVPANIRHDNTRDTLGNHVSILMARLPVDEADLLVRHHTVCAITDRLKHSSGQRESTEWLEQIDDELGLGFVPIAFRLASRIRAFNVIVTNVPGPAFPIELLGAPIDSVHAVLPLFDRQAMAVALFSYNGVLHWSLTGDPQHLPDLDAMLGDFRAAFDELLAAAHSRPA